MILFELIDYSILKVMWWVLLGVLLIGFAATDGFDMGTAILLPFVGRNDVERRVVINTVGPVWEGNQVWFITAGGAIFAAWPALYAVSFSGFYLAMFVVLAALILRPVGFKYRSKRESAAWRSGWDWALFIGGFVPALIFGVAIGNTLQGVPFRLTEELRPIYEGSFFGLLNPFAILVGLVSVCMITMHGATWLSLKTEGDINARTKKYGTWATLGTIVLFALAGVVLWAFVPGYTITSTIDMEMPSNPLMKEAAVQTGAWFANYSAHPWMMIAPVLGFVGAFGVLIGLRTRLEALTWVLSIVSVLGIISTVGLAMFPFILPSSIEPNASLTVWDSASSHATLFNMLVVTVIFVPLILAYTSWVYKILWGKVTPEEITDESKHSY